MNQEASKWIFSTEGHIFKLDEKYRLMVDGDLKINLKKHKSSITNARINSTFVSIGWQLSSISAIDDENNMSDNLRHKIAP